MNTFEGFGINAEELPSDLGGDAEGAPIGEVLHAGELSIRSVAVPHGMMPSVAYRVDYGGYSITFSGDVQSADTGLIRLARGCDVLIHDQPGGRQPED